MKINFASLFLTATVLTAGLLSLAAGAAAGFSVLAAAGVLAIASQDYGRAPAPLPASCLWRQRAYRQRWPLAA